MSGKSVDWEGRVGVRIMIADDERAIRESLERVLQVEGYDTSTVANGFAVLDGVGAGGDTLDLLILDVMMIPASAGWRPVSGCGPRAGICRC